ncbi:MAG TPA: hypothetical protein PLP58_18410, partial [Prosthecobacter sp.]|nr:hypothetical protein [Prosthecobacter sp.]
MSGISTLDASETLRPPGHRPVESGVHALTGARVVTEPGRELENAVIILRDGRVAAVGPGAPV